MTQKGLRLYVARAAHAGAAAGGSAASGGGLGGGGGDTLTLDDFKPSWRVVMGTDEGTDENDKDEKDTNDN